MKKKIFCLQIKKKSIFCGFYAIPQTVPRWTGFRISIMSKQTKNETVIGYLDCINAPARDILTV